MKSKRILSLILSLAVMIALFPNAVRSEEARAVVYTEFSYGNHAHTGQGTKESPYNLFEDALEAVADGGTIYIGGDGAFVNIPGDGNPPLEITKNITITRAPGVLSRPTIEIRKAGLVLGADVTFSNVILSFSNAYHAAVLANGYTLRLDNVSQSPHTRVIQLCGGTLYNISNQSLSPAPGNHSQIIISGKDTQFGNIYAGSINGSFAGDVDIKISDVPSSAIGNIYSCGAKEGYYNSENFLDPDNEPEEPIASSLYFPVTGNVSIDLTDSAIRSIDGETGGNSKASLTVSSKYHYASDLKNIANITVKIGTFAPTTLNSDVDVNILSDGILDLSSIPDCAVNNFEGNGGILILNETGSLTVNGSCKGSAELRTPNGSRDTSGIATYNHLYIKTVGDAAFTFNPYSTQSDMTLNKTNDGWRTSEWQEPTYKVALKSFDIVSPVVVTSKSEINGHAGLGTNTTVEFNVKFTDDTTYEDLSMIPFEYDVTHDGKTYQVKSTEHDGRYIGAIPELHLYFEPGVIWVNDEERQGIMFVNWVFGNDEFANTGDIAEGIYDIDITAPTESGYVTRSMRLTVTADGTQGSAATQTNISVSSESTAYNSLINVTANIAADGQPVTGGEAVLYINGKPYSPLAIADGSASWQNIPITLENGFEIGSNRLEVIYGGSDAYSVSNSEAKSLTVNKASVTINHSGENTAVNYTGSNMNIDFGEFSFTDGNNRAITIDALPEIIYTDNADNAVNPIMPGTYTSKLNLPEGKYYSSVSQTGPKLTINPSEPNVILSITGTNGRDVTLTAEVDVPLGGRIPTGSIDIVDKANDTVNGTASLNGGSAEVKITNLEDGENNFYAVYNPDEHSPYMTARSKDISLNVEMSTTAPTSVPTSEPTSIPTAEPSTVPTAVPTSAPSVAPTTVPTETPTVIPTAIPTTEPTSVPTAEPSAVPTTEPTSAPTTIPSAVPTAVPSAVPTAVPTSAPTAVPTTEPTVKKTWTVSGIKTGNIEVTFTNLTQQNIENSVMIIAVYDAKGALKKLEKADKNVNAAIGDEQKFSFDLSDVQYSQIKIFIWNSLDKMKPVCENYVSENYVS